MTTTPDLNLLLVLDALLEESHVTRAARRLGMTVPATSRALGRLRVLFGDPLLVAAGRRLVPTPFAEAIRPRVRDATMDTLAVLSPPAEAPLSLFSRLLTVRTTSAVSTVIAPRLLEALGDVSPGSRLRFVAEGEEDAEVLRAGDIDLDIGVIDFREPEIRVKQVLTDRFVGVARPGHDLLGAPVTLARFATCRHVIASRHGQPNGPIQRALHLAGLRPGTSVIVPDFLAALHVAAGSDVIATVPSLIARSRPWVSLCASFELPVALPPISIGLAWHPRFDRDPLHRWLRVASQEALVRAASLAAE